MQKSYLIVICGLIMLYKQWDNLCNKLFMGPLKFYIVFFPTLQSDALNKLQTNTLAHHSSPFIVLCVLQGGLELTWKEEIYCVTITTSNLNFEVPLRPISQFPQCIKQISHNASLCNRNVHTCAHFCDKVVHCGIFDAWWDLWDGSIAYAHGNTKGTCRSKILL